MATLACKHRCHFILELIIKCEFLCPHHTHHSLVSLDSVPAEFISLLQEGELKFAFCRVRFALPHPNFPTQGKVVLWESLGVLILYHRKQETKQDFCRT